jgi:hypothetical protein
MASSSRPSDALPGSSRTREPPKDRDNNIEMKDVDESDSGSDDEDDDPQVLPEEPTTAPTAEPSERAKGKQPAKERKTERRPRVIEYPEEMRLTENLKVALPDKYRGDRKELETFLLQLGMYFRFNPDKFVTRESKSLWAASYLRDEAAKWIEPFLSDFFDKGHNVNLLMATTVDIFGSFEGFQREIRRVFGDIDVVRTAERRLFGIKQTGSAINYATEFRKYGNQTLWGKEALLSHYQRGLKLNIKHELSRRNPINDMNELIEESIRIDNREYEFQRETRFTQQPRRYQKNEGRPRFTRRYQPREQSYGDPMELDATRVGDKPSKEEMDRRRENKLCFECGKPGHRANFHRKGQPKKQWKGPARQLKATLAPIPLIQEQVTPDSDEPTEEQIAEALFKSRRFEATGDEDRTPEQKHACLSWTACYNDHCMVHRSDKDGSGWFPKKPRAKKARKNSDDSE